MDQICGYIEYITFYNEENGYTVARLQIPGKKELTCVVGYMPGISPGISVRCSGEWKHHLVHGKQFEVSSFNVETPSDVAGIRKYLGSGLIKGIGEKFADRIVNKFGIDTLTVIEQSPEQLLEIEGIGKKRVAIIQTCWQDQKSIRSLMIFLQSYGMSPCFAQKIFKAYGNESINKIKQNPFALAKDIFGIGFKTADQLAQKMGVESNSKERIHAGIEFALSELASEGHTCYPKEDFIAHAHKMLQTEPQLIDAQFATLHEEKRIEMGSLITDQGGKEFLWLKTLFLAEVGIARELKRLQKIGSALRKVDLPKALDWVQKKLNLHLAEEQIKAVGQALEEKLLIITGGPGTGKSTITNAILTITKELSPQIILAAPTGRAAKRMSEITGFKASTIHSLLEYDFKRGGFKKGHQEPLEAHLIIIDEASMIDTFLMYSLLKAIPSHCRVVFVGDINQLPSVGPGNVLKDMISSFTVPVSTLNQIFRQAAGSYIITNAHKVNQGMVPTFCNDEKSDFFFLECTEAEEVLHTLIKLVSQRLPSKYGFHPKEDIQVLAPMKKGLVGTENLNQMLQGVLNPKESAFIRGGNRFQVGDKVMQIRNNYQKEVFNGDIGYITEIDKEDNLISVTFDQRVIDYESSDLDELVLAYAVSIHKFQGSECPCVVIPIHTSHFMLLHRNLIYTGITRGKKLVVLVGSKKALCIAVRTDDVKKRHTALKQALMEML